MQAANAGGSEAYPLTRQVNRVIITPMQLIGMLDSPLVRRVAATMRMSSGPGVIALAFLLPSLSLATTVIVSDNDGQPLATAMVTRTVIAADIVDTSDNGYPKPGLVNKVAPQHTRFTDAAVLRRSIPWTSQVSAASAFASKALPMRQ